LKLAEALSIINCLTLTYNKKHKINTKIINQAPLFLYKINSFTLSSFYRSYEYITHFLDVSFWHHALFLAQNIKIKCKGKSIQLNSKKIFLSHEHIKSASQQIIHGTKVSIHRQSIALNFGRKRVPIHRDNEHRERALQTKRPAKVVQRLNSDNSLEVRDRQTHPQRARQEEATRPIAVLRQGQGGGKRRQHDRPAQELDIEATVQMREPEVHVQGGVLAQDTGVEGG